jgi:hypothetical protein
LTLIRDRSWLTVQKWQDGLLKNEVDRLLETTEQGWQELPGADSSTARASHDSLSLIAGGIVRAVLRTVFLAGLCHLAGCWSQEIARVHDELTKDIRDEQDVRKEFERRLLAAEREVEFLVDQTPACKSRDLGRMLVKRCQDNTCEPGVLEESLAGLEKLRDSFVIAYLRPQQGAEGLSFGRIKELTRLFEFPRRRPTSRLLIVTLPQGQDQAALERARKVAEDLLVKIHEKVGASRDYQKIVTTAVSCHRDNRQLFLQFAKQKPPDLSREPKPADAIIAMIFRLDCYHSNPSDP